MTFGERVRLLRKERGIGQKELAGAVGASVNWISRIELGKLKNPNLSGLMRLAQALNVSVDELCGQSALPNDVSFRALREANRSRNYRWLPGGLRQWSLSDWALAMLGEAGEAANIVKKLNQSSAGVVGNDVGRGALTVRLAEELADTAICLDLLAQRAGIDLSRAIVKKFNEVSEKKGFPERLNSAGSAPLDGKRSATAAMIIQREGGE